MAHRTFRDSQGNEWQVWDVQPQAIERSDRRRAERRRPPPKPHDPERRRLADRRTEADRRARRRLVLVATREPKRLVFESGTEKRRLSPAPPGWESCPEDRLCLLCRVAEPVHRM